MQELIRELDPTRPIDSNANCALFSAKKLFDIDVKSDVFNVHPYGNPSYPEVKRQMLNYNWDGEAPVYMGELTCKVPVAFQTAKILFTNRRLRISGTGRWRGSGASP